MNKNKIEWIFAIFMSSLIIYLMTAVAAKENPKGPTPSPTATVVVPTHTCTATPTATQPPDPKASPTPTPDPCDDCESVQEYIVWRCQNCREIEGNPFGACEEFNTMECGSYQGCSSYLQSGCEKSDGSPYLECCEAFIAPGYLWPQCGRPRYSDGTLGPCECAEGIIETGQHITYMCMQSE